MNQLFGLQHRSRTDPTIHQFLFLLIILYIQGHTVPGTCEVWVKMNNTQKHLVFCRIFTIFALKKRENSIMKKRTRDLKE